MDPSTRHSVQGHSGKSKRFYNRQTGGILLGRRMANPPPRFVQASKLVDLAPRHVPEVKAQLAQAERYLGYIPAPAHMMAPSAGASKNLYKTSPTICPQAEYPRIDWTTPPSPTLREHNPLAQSFIVNPMSLGLDCVLTSPAPVPPQVYSSLYHVPDRARHPNALFHPAPRRPIFLPEVTSKFPFQSPTPQHPQVSYQQTPVASDTLFDQADFSFDLGTIFHKDSRFLNAETTRVMPYTTAADILASMSNSSPASTNSTTDRLVDPGDRDATVSIDTLPQIVELRTYIALMGKRFGCCITYNLVRKIMDPELLEMPLFSFDDGQSETYKRRVRSWAATATGTTIFEKLLVAFEPGTYGNNERYTVPYFWFVLLVRELLINNCYAKDSGTLIRLGASCTDPCNRSFHFFSLETAIRQLLGEMSTKSRVYARDTTVQQRVVGTCRNNHLHIAMSDQSFSNLYLPIPRPRFDKIEYQNELRAWFTRLVNRVDSCSGFTAFVLITFMDLNNEL